MLIRYGGSQFPLSSFNSLSGIKVPNIWKCGPPEQKSVSSIRVNDQWRIIFFSAYKLSKDIGILQTRVSEIIKNNRRITADTALRLSKYFGNSAKFWLGLQDDFDIEEEEEQLKSKELNLIEHYQGNAA